MTMYDVTKYSVALVPKHSITIHSIYSIDKISVVVASMY